MWNRIRSALNPFVEFSEVRDEAYRSVFLRDEKGMGCPLRLIDSFEYTNLAKAFHFTFECFHMATWNRESTSVIRFSAFVSVKLDFGSRPFAELSVEEVLVFL